tara:strand:- start:4999 stop:5346 length:348 start_codon:yes stop_codon:yes gene_type:complete
MSVPATEQLKAAIDQMWTMMSQVTSAHNLPNSYAASARKVSVTGNTYFDDDKRSLAKATEIADRAVEEMRREGELERDELLAALSLKIEAARVLLPDLAAKACIELGCLAREIKP